MKWIFVFGVLLLVISANSCKKIDDKDRRLYGRFVDSSSVPVANTSFVLFSLTRSRNTHGYDEYGFLTDSDGSFECTFKSSTGLLKIFYPGEDPEAGIYIPLCDIDIDSDVEHNIGEVMIRTQ